MNTFVKHNFIRILKKTQRSLPKQTLYERLKKYFKSSILQIKFFLLKLEIKSTYSNLTNTVKVLNDLVEWHVTTKNYLTPPKNWPKINYQGMTSAGVVFEKFALN